MAAVVPKIAEPSTSQSIQDSKGTSDAYVGIDSESPPVPDQDVDNTMKQVTDLKEPCLSSQRVSIEHCNLNETIVIASETAGRDIVSSPLMIPESLGHAQEATNWKKAMCSKNLC